VLRELQPAAAPKGRGRGGADQRNRSLALHFGTLQRHYKGTPTIVELAGAGVDGWDFLLMGNGAPAHVDGADVIRGFVDSPTLVTTVARSHATLLPYSYATQSGAIVLAQALGSVAVSTAVGGLPEQIESGTTGLLLPKGAPVAAWHDALMQLTDANVHGAMATAARERVWRNHAEFAQRIQGLVA
jgi:glycosyltransferase involved in cell wall biosynthesis